MNTVAAAFVDACHNWPDRPFLHVLAETADHYGISPGTWSYAQIGVRIDAVTARYAEAGYGVGHRVGLMLANRPSMFVHWFALNSLGVSVVLLNPELRAAELGYIVQHSGICLAVTAAPYAADLQNVVAALDAECTVIVEGDGFPVALRRPTGQPPNLQSECALLYTSGTTGKPKGCVLSNFYFLQCGRWYADVGGLCTLRPGQERLITPLPMVHVNAMAYSTLAMVLTGGCIIPLDRFHPRSWWQSVRDSGATIMHSLGVMPTMLLGFESSADDRAHSVRFGFAPGIDPRYHAAFEERFGIPMIDAWAMTETGAGAVVIASHAPRHIGQSCFGRAQAFMQLRIVDQAGVDVADNTPGQLLVRASGENPRAGFFTAYLGDPEATEAAWQDGWFHTGDVVRRDHEGNLFFVDRWKNVIRRSGENIAAAEVESVLRQHRLVRDVACAAVTDELRGEEVLACIVPTEPPSDRPAAAADIVTHVLRELAYYKAPGYVAFVDALPLTATNKVQRGVLKEWARDLPGTPDCVDTRPLKQRRTIGA